MISDDTDLMLAEKHSHRRIGEKKAPFNVAEAVRFELTDELPRR
jgi:hypothetical protein